MQAGRRYLPESSVYGRTTAELRSSATGISDFQTLGNIGKPVGDEDRIECNFSAELTGGRAAP